MLKKRKKKFGILQREQIDLGKKNGLSDRAIRIYAKEKYDFLQMQEIRMALESGMSPWKVRFRFFPWIPHQAMEKIRELSEEEVDDPKPYYSAIIVTVIIMGIIIIGLFIHMHLVPPFTLKLDEIEIKKGERINPIKYLDESYVDSVTIQQGEEKGNRVILYENNQVYRILHIKEKEE